MRDRNCNRAFISRGGLSSLLGISKITIVLALAALGVWPTLAGASGSVPVGKRADTIIVSKCKSDLAGRLRLQAKEIKVIEAQATTWPDAALGMPEIGKVYAQVMTPGLRVILEARSSRYLYTTSATAYRYGGPISGWSSSLLYTKPVPDEPNFNGDLYQCSLLGTNSVLLVSGVSEYYPQANGVVIAKRRMSRSGHDLLYVKAGKPASEKVLHSAFDFGEAAVDDSQDEWAGFVRPTLGATWFVAVGRIAKSGDAQMLPLPDEVRPGQIAWSGDTLVILVKSGERMLCFQASPKSAAPKWKPAYVESFPPTMAYMLNKSQSLEVEQAKTSGKPAVEVAKVWFTGDRNVVARVADFTMRGHDLLGGFVVMWGENGSEQAVYTVSLATGEIIPCTHGTGESVRAFGYPPLHSPLVRAKSR